MMIKRENQLAYRWFLGLDIMDKVPDHSTISKNKQGVSADLDPNLYGSALGNGRIHPAFPRGFAENQPGA